MMIKRSAALVAAILAAPLPAQADDMSDLKAAIENLTTQLQALKERQEKLEASAAAPAAAQPVQTAAPVKEEEEERYFGEGDLPGSFKIPGTNTSLKIGGFVALDVVKDINGGGFGGSVLTPSALVLPGQPQSERSGQLTFSARRSRLHLTTLSPTDLGDLKTYFEIDFYGAGGNEYQTNSASPRLRHAYATIGPWLAGQTFTTFFEPGSAAELVDQQGGAGTAAVPRQPMIRYTGKLGEKSEYSLAVENAESEVNGVPNTTFAAGVGPVPLNTVDKYPDLVGRVVTSGDWGRLGVAAMARRLNVNNKGQPPINGFVGEDSTMGYGLMVMGRFNTIGKNSLRYVALGGPGMGRYILGNPSSAAVIKDGELETIDSWGAQVSYQHHWNAQWRSNLTYSLMKASYPHPEVAQTKLSRVDLLWLNLIWNPSPQYFVGVEWVHGRAKADGIGSIGNTGVTVTDNTNRANRFDASFRYAF